MLNIYFVYILAFWILDFGFQIMNPYTKLAQKAVEQYIETGKTIEPDPGLPKEMLENKAGVFVSIESNGNLRGCIGTYLPTKDNIAQEVISNAIAAATQDYRFSRIKKQDLASLSYTVYVLKKPEPIEGIQELNPKEYGILAKTLSMPPKSGLLLPDLEDIKTKEQQLLAVCKKAGIDPAHEELMLYRFRAQKYRGWPPITYRA